LVDWKALQPARDEDVHALPGVQVELQPEAVRVQVEVLSLVEVERQHVVLRAVAPVERSLDAQHGAQPGAVLADEIREKIARRRGRTGCERRADRHQTGAEPLLRRCDDFV
jgi:hypothetical protein